MPIPVKIRVLAALAGVNASDFAIGWGNGVIRWRTRGAALGAAVLMADNPFPLGSIKRAASDAAVSFCRCLDGAPCQ
jgi:hypothetical protein